jgi:HSP20 family protein
MIRAENRSNRQWIRPFKSDPLLFPDFFSTRMPAVEVTEDNNEFTVRAEAPGMDEHEIDLTWLDGVLRIRGEKKSDKEVKKKGRWYRESSYGSFSRDIELGDAVDWKGAKANYRHGVLTVKLPKTEKARKAVEIKVN